MKKVTPLCFFLFTLLSCEQAEIAIEKHSAGEINVTQINLEENYSQQVFYNLNDNAIVSENQKTEWDLGFESSEEGWRIIINSATFSQLAKISTTDFNSGINIDTLNWTWDNPKGINNGTAFGDYLDKEEVYVLDRGYNLDGTLRGYKKITIDSTNSN